MLEDGTLMLKSSAAKKIISEIKMKKVLNLKRVSTVTLHCWCGFLRRQELRELRLLQKEEQRAQQQLSNKLQQQREQIYRRFEQETTVSHYRRGVMFFYFFFVIMATPK